MSRGRLATVRQVYETFNRKGEPPWELFAEDAEFDATAVPGFGVIRGRENLLAALRDYAAAFEDWRIEPEEVLEAGDQVVAVVRDGGRLKGTDDTVFNRFTHVWTSGHSAGTAWLGGRPLPIASRLSKTLGYASSTNSRTPLPRFRRSPWGYRFSHAPP